MFGRWLHEKRTEKEISLYKLSKITGVARQTIWQIEQGNNVTLEIANKLCIGLNEVYTIGGTHEEKSKKVTMG